MVVYEGKGGKTVGKKQKIRTTVCLYGPDMSCYAYNNYYLQ